MKQKVKSLRLFSNISQKRCHVLTKWNMAKYYEIWIGANMRARKIIVIIMTDPINTIPVIINQMPIQILAMGC